MLALHLLRNRFMLPLHQYPIIDKVIEDAGTRQHRERERKCAILLRRSPASCIDRCVTFGLYGNRDGHSLQTWITIGACETASTTALNFQHADC